MVIENPSLPLLGCQHNNPPTPNALRFQSLLEAMVRAEEMGTRSNANDVGSPYARVAKGIRVRRLDHRDKATSDGENSARFSLRIPRRSTRQPPQSPRRTLTRAPVARRIDRNQGEPVLGSSNGGDG